MWSKLIFISLMKDVFKNGLRVRVNDPISKQLFFQPCLNHLMLLELLLDDIRRQCEQDSYFFEFFILISNLVKAMVWLAFEQVQNTNLRNEAWILLTYTKMNLFPSFGSIPWFKVQTLLSNPRLRTAEFKISHCTHDFFVTMYLDHVYQLELLLDDIRRQCEQDSYFFEFFWIFYPHFKFAGQLTLTANLDRQLTLRTNRIRPICASRRIPRAGERDPWED